ncbi:MAG: adenylate/guanylate cyclase domain-containing protein [Gemmatimonadaceae bacterium]
MITAPRAPKHFLIVFTDLTRFKDQSLRVEHTELADTLDALYERTAVAVQAAGGTLVKFIGDATLAVFPESAVDSAVRMLLELKPDIDDFMSARGWMCRLTIKAHYGEVIAGEFGPQGSKRFDVIGRAVNTTAMLQSQGITLSAEAFRKLTPELRQQFKKYTPPITYIRAEDPRPSGLRPVH